jgi:hypothetical protein
MYLCLLCCVFGLLKQNEQFLSLLEDLLYVVGIFIFGSPNFTDQVTLEVELCESHYEHSTFSLFLLPAASKKSYRRREWKCEG